MEATRKLSLVDSRVQWAEAKNVWHNSAIRTGMHLPVRIVRRLLGQDR